jgi:RNA polymerase sigma-70 factor (ECF subfamily)
VTAPSNGLFGKLTAYREDVFRICLGFSRNAADAEDWCQDVFLKAFVKAEDLRDHGGMRIWLLRIARTTCLDHHRRRQRFPTVPIETLPEPAADLPTPELLSEISDGLRRLKDAVRRLPWRQREVFVLREYGGLSYEDLACTLGVRPGTIMSRLNRARRAVAAAVEEESHE